MPVGAEETQARTEDHFHQRTSGQIEDKRRDQKPNDQAVAELNRAGVSVTIGSLQNWEIGRRKPNGEMALALHAFLAPKPVRNFADRSAERRK